MYPLSTTLSRINLSCFYLLQNKTSKDAFCKDTFCKDAFRKDAFWPFAAKLTIQSLLGSYSLSNHNSYCISFHHQLLCRRVELAGLGKVSRLWIMLLKAGRTSKSRYLLKVQMLLLMAEWTEHQLENVCRPRTRESQDGHCWKSKGNISAFLFSWANDGGCAWELWIQ